MDLDPNELEFEPDGNHLIEGQEGSQIRKDIRIQLKPKLTSDKNKRSRLKKTIRIKRNQNHLDSTMSQLLLYTLQGRYVSGQDAENYLKLKSEFDPK